MDDGLDKETQNNLASGMDRRTKDSQILRDLAIG